MMEKVIMGSNQSLLRQVVSVFNNPARQITLGDDQIFSLRKCGRALIDAQWSFIASIQAEKQRDESNRSVETGSRFVGVCSYNMSVREKRVARHGDKLVCPAI